ncbi:indolepyruvate ferredoxin oxidoreductase family protein [Nonomuraea soli]|uniref:Indolepyruvate ferredoxin oxidoreductase n=1 Tax=Nonomuraea soli TaxID=1032476 RepID=A0A7W0CTE1_9ACTN|nr:indolepyruvate ferredoxin oxidoreductase family protein [Nonomuraea soli]MBA2896976.1 indolepyruvate ferredoxin oxidoreductase [Nonomuraea soli]
MRYLRIPDQGCCASPVDVHLDDKYTAADGRVLISGIQALVRLTLEQRRLDTARGLNTRVFVSGYQGSPLGGVDLEMGRAKRFLEPAGVVFQAGLNEELAATAVAGTQLLRATPGKRHDGVTGFWYGKNPGLDRAADAIRHANMAGTAAQGGAVAWIGDDPGCKSSTVPSSCEPMCQSLFMPLLAPGSVAEIIEYGLHAVAMSRASGLWVGLKIVADIADASATVDLALPELPLPERTDTPVPTLVGPSAVEAEHDLLTRRLALARQYARQAGLNRVVADPAGATIGVLASGTSFAVVERALADAGIEGEFRLIKLGMPYPLDAGSLAEMTEGLRTVLVVEDKTAFLEDHLKAALYGRENPPRVAGRDLLTARGTLSAADVTGALAKLAPGAFRHDPVPAATPSRQKPSRSLPLVASRTPYFCSGCPHNISTRTADETLVGVGIGCHAMIALSGEGRGTQVGLTQMGGEGAQWIGLAPFTDDRHFVQNLGDGTFHHSGSLAVRAAVAAGVTMTYKLLYNDAVAMTGGQRAEGKLDIPTLTHWLALEGVRRIVITTPTPEDYRGVQLAPITSVRHRDDFAASEKELSEVDGVTVLIHDDRCAAEERRLRKRGKLPAPAEKVVVNERVCEGCGDCGDVSTCLSVQPVETEFGRKTRIHQPSCNSDFSCLKGDCPSFLLVTPGTKRKPVLQDLPDLPDPELRFHGDVVLRMPGIGGTGVVTVSQILQMAAHLDGLHAAGLEQTGLAQKGGPVVSDVRLSKSPIVGTPKATRADVIIGFDLLGAATEANLATADERHTVAVVNSAVVPTAAMVTGHAPLGSGDPALARIEAATRDVLTLDAQGLSERLFADHMPANMLLIGAAYQHGCLPISASAIERAIELNGAAVDKNLAAFRHGRAAALGSRPQAVEETFDAVLERRVADLTGYQNASYARSYAAEVRRIAELTAEYGPRIATGYARGLHKLMAYKDEYEVARLHLDPEEIARREAEFGADASVAVLLHPPVFRAMGMKRKIKLRRTAGPVFRVLRSMKGLRGTRLDVFGYAGVRRVERALIGEYRELVRQALEHLSPATADTVTEIVELPDMIRGYEDIKLARVDEFRSRAGAALSALASAQEVGLGR